MASTKLYHFHVPNTKVRYSVTLGYEGDFIRSFEVSNLIFNNRVVNESELSHDDRERYLEHLSNKIKNISIITK